MEIGSGIKIFYACDSCHGLFDTSQDLAQHISKCLNETHELPQELVAISKACYAKYIRPHIKLTDTHSCESRTVESVITCPDNSNDKNRVCKNKSDSSQVPAVLQNRQDNCVKLLHNADSGSVIKGIKELSPPLQTLNETSDIDNQNDNTKVEVAKPCVKVLESGKRIPKVSNANYESLELKPKKRLKRGKESVSVPDSTFIRPCRTRRKAAVDYRLLNDGLESQEFKRSIVRKGLTAASGCKTSANDQSSRNENCAVGDDSSFVPSNTIASSLKRSEQNGQTADNEDSHTDSAESQDNYKQYTKMEKGNRVTYHCPMCPKKTPYLGFFRRHLEAFHNEGKGFICETCGKKFANSQKYRLHMNWHNRPFACDECTFTFAQRKDLLVHAKLHSGEYTYFCEHCDYKCRQIKSLREHMRSHDGNILHCGHEGCEFQTIYATALRSHIQSKHMEKTQHQCEQCNFKTNNRGFFNRHMKIHLGIKNYKCGMCEYQGRSKHAVVKHMSIHTGEKRYQCPACPYSTSHGYALRAHLLKHMGIRAWQCKACNFVGSQKQHVVRHVSKKHPDQTAENLVGKSSIEVKVNLSEFKTWENDSESANNEEMVQLDSVEDLEAVTHIIFQDPDDPDGDRIMTIAADDLDEDQNVTIMTIDTDGLEGSTEGEGQIMTLATEEENVMIITEGVPEDFHDVIIDNHIEIHSNGDVQDSVLYSEHHTAMI